MVWTVLAAIVLCYLIGGIPFAYVVGRILGGFDIRSRGSGNVGATNALRTMGPVGAVLSLIGDLGKGMLAAYLGLRFGGEVLAAFCGAAAVLGHCYSPYLGFTGGKGAAASGGIAFLLMPKVALIMLIIFIGVIAMTRIVSMASILAAVAYPILTYFFIGTTPLLWLSLFLAILVVGKHRANIRRLLHGAEPRLGQKGA
jgi:glycerol-3-phosphate acyltransferase PlsY